VTDIASILACYRSGQISEAEMVEICRDLPEVAVALLETSVAKDKPRPKPAPTGAKRD